MSTTEILHHICTETGLDLTCKETLDLVPMRDLDIHKTAVWSLTITERPEQHFLNMDQQYKNKTGYRFRFKLNGFEEGVELCKGLSYGFGIQSEMPARIGLASGAELYLAIHIHPEFVFTPKTTQSASPTQALKMCFV